MTAGGFGKTIRVALFLGLCLVLAPAAPARAADLELRVSPDVVQIGAFFQGSQVVVTGKIPQGAQAVLELLGPKAAEHLMRKGRRGGLWMNVGEVEVDGAPSVYLATSTTEQLLQAPAADATWGYPALQKQIKFAGQVEANERELFLDQFFKLKESEEIYATFPGALKAAGASGDLQTVKGTFPLPTKVRPGAYQVCLTVIQNGQVTGKQCADLKVAMVGFPAAFFSLAYEHGATYGILAVVIAIVTGFAMGYLFKGGGGH